MDMIAIGDIHGCARTLDKLLSKLSPTSDDHLVFLGDYVDRGPDSRGVIERCLAIRRRFSCSFLRGNHETYMIGYLQGRTPADWEKVGGQSTLDSYRNASGKVQVPAAHKAFLLSTQSYFDTADYFFVHGGLVPTMTIAGNVRRVGDEVFLWHRPPGITQTVLWEKTVVCGHTPAPVPRLQHRMIGIDTGCVYANNPELGRLTAVRLPSEEFVSVGNIDVPA